MFQIDHSVRNCKIKKKNFLVWTIVWKSLWRNTGRGFYGWWREKVVKVVAAKLLTESVESYVDVMADPISRNCERSPLGSINWCSQSRCGAPRLDVMSNWNREAYSDPTVNYMQSLRLRICTIRVYCAPQYLPDGTSLFPSTSLAGQTRQQTAGQAMKRPFV